jgi:hypothetical protein
MPLLDMQGLVPEHSQGSGKGTYDESATSLLLCGDSQMSTTLCLGG